jgi:hypothetical protein
MCKIQAFEHVGEHVKEYVRGGFFVQGGGDSWVAQRRCSKMACGYPTDVWLTITKPRLRVRSSSRDVGIRSILEVEATPAVLHIDVQSVLHFTIR